MQTIESMHYHCRNHDETEILAKNLTQCLYPLSQTIIFLRGDVGAGKTTFAKAFFSALGIETRGSPTFSLLEEYEHNQQTYAHIDCYRLSTAEAIHFWKEQDIQANVVFIEWPERLADTVAPDIDICITGTVERDIQITFFDEPIVNREEIIQWANNVHLPKSIQLHCRLVAAVAHYAGMKAIHNNQPVRLHTVYQAGLLHDMFRFIDFNPKYAPKNIELSGDMFPIWQDIRDEYSPLSHGLAIAKALQKKNYHITASIIEPHELWELPKTIEQKLLFYGDKRAIGNMFHTLTERMNDLCTRYNDIAVQHNPNRLLHSLLNFEETIDSSLSNITSEMVAIHTKQHGLLPWDQLA